MAAPPPATDDPFETNLAAILSREGTLDEAVDAHIDKLDALFIPTLASRIDGAANPAELPRLRELFGVLQQRSELRFARARDQLQELLSAGEINKLDAKLCGLIRRDELDAGFLYVLVKNVEAATRDDDEATVRLLQHIHTRTEEELEKRTDPPLALLHKLTRTDDAALRGRILRHYLVPKSSVTTPDGREVDLGGGGSAMVSPDAFSGALISTIDQVLSLPMDRSATASTLEQLRTVAKEARLVVQESYDAPALDSFSNELAPAFARAFPQGF